MVESNRSIDFQSLPSFALYPPTLPCYALWYVSSAWFMLSCPFGGRWRLATTALGLGASANQPNNNSLLFYYSSEAT